MEKIVKFKYNLLSFNDWEKNCFTREIMKLIAFLITYLGSYILQIFYLMLLDDLPRRLTHSWKTWEPKFNPQIHIWEKAGPRGICIQSSCWGDRDRWICGAPWPARPPYQWAPGQWKTLCQKKKSGQVLRNDISDWSLASAFKRMNTHIHTYTHTSYSSHTRI